MEQAILNIVGEILHRNVDSSNLVYLLGNETIADKIVSAWNEALDSEQYYTLPISDNIENIYDNIVFESSRLSSLEADLLKATNLKMVFDSKTMKEALSAMFFNQTMMVERGSRYISVNRQERLRFGYTYQYLWNFIWDNANNIETKISLLKRCTNGLMSKLTMEVLYHSTFLVQVISSGLGFFVQEKMRTF